MLAALAATASAFVAPSVQAPRLAPAKALVEEGAFVPDMERRNIMNLILVFGGALPAVGGLAVGLGMAWFSEQQVEQGEQRGSDAVSEATRAKMSAMFMEDEVLPDTTLDDTVSRMEAALAAAKGEAAVEEKVEEKPASSIDDGW